MEDTKMKKLIALAIVLMMALSAGALAETFKMGIDAAYPPFSYLGEDGAYTGFDVEMCALVCADLGLEQEVVPINWDSKLLSLGAGEIDCIWSGLTIDVLDGEKYCLSMAYVDSSQVIMTRKDVGIATLADLAGKNVAVQLGTSADLMLSGDQADLAATFGNLARYEDYNVCFTELMAGSVDAVAIDSSVALNKIQVYGDEYMILDEKLQAEQYGICFRGADTELCEKVEASFMKLVEDGTYLELAEKYELDTSTLCLLNQ